MDIYTYDRRRAYRYALKWTYRRNPLFVDYTGQGGNCTNFVSQCLFAGCCTMNFTDTFGWYYLSSEDRAPAWTGVVYLYNFLVGNEAEGPFGREIPANEAQTGDVIQLMNSEGVYYHSLIVSGFDGGEVLLAAQSNDVFDRPLSTYNYAESRGIHIEGYRRSSPQCSCFNDLYDGQSITLCDS